MPLRRTLLILWAIVVAFATFASQADAVTPEQIADAAWPQSPCYGQPMTERFQVGIVASDTGDHLAGVASGLLANSDGLPVVPFVAARCEITTDPVEYAAMTPAERCQYKVHEYGHLAGMQHQPTGPMSTGDNRWYAPCHTLRDRIRHDMAGMVPDPDPWVICSRWQGRVLPCRVEFVDSRQRAHAAWFRARTRGETYAIQRVRMPRTL